MAVSNCTVVCELFKDCVLNKTPEAQNQTVAFVSLGCPKNLVDSERMLGLLANDGFIPTVDHETADIVVINTCGFLDAARDESHGIISEAAERKKNGDLSRLIVAGCLVQRDRAKLLEVCPEIDALVGVYDRENIVAAVRGSSQDRTQKQADATQWISQNALVAAKSQGINTTGLTIRGEKGTGLGYYESDRSRLRLTPRHYSYLRMSEGCNQNCTFCTIPSIRGKMRSKPVGSLIAEMQELFADGVYEFNLIGQDTTSYGNDIRYEPGLAGLLEAINAEAEKQGGAWIRLMYAYPSCFTDHMIDTISTLEHVVKYIDMPLQHINDHVLDSMRRHTSRSLIETLLDKLRSHIPGVALRTTLITGFPGETDDAHDELVEFVRDFGFDMLGVFTYSPEPGTAAYHMENDSKLAIPEDVKQARFDELMATQQEIVFEQNEFLASHYKNAFTNDSANEKGCKGASGGGIPADALRFDVLIDRAANDPNAETDSRDSHSGYESIGRCYHQAPEVDSITTVRSRSRLSPGELIRCVIVDSEGYDLIAIPESDLASDKNAVSLNVL